MITSMSTRFCAQGGLAFRLKTETEEKSISRHFLLGLDPCAYLACPRSFLSVACPLVAYTALSLLLRLSLIIN